MPRGETEKYFPFKGGVGEAIGKTHGRIRTLPEIKGKVIRQERQAAGKEFSTANYLKAKALFEELEPKYGINTLSQHLVRGRNPETLDKVMFQVVDEIEGKNLLEMDSLPDGAEEKIDNYFANIAHYFWDKYSNQEAYLWDIGEARQAMYGRKTGSNEEGVYFIDMDPAVKNKGNYKPIDLFYNLIQEYESIKFEFEPKFSSKGVKLILARKKILEYLKSIAKNSHLLEVLGHSDRVVLSEFIEEIESEIK